MPLYFAYGSNMDQAQMAARCPGSQLVAVGFLHQHALAFAGRNRAWGGGVATVVPRRASTTPGLLYLLDAADLRALDGFEGFPTVYDRQRRIVEVSDGRRLVAHVYSQPVWRERVAPSKSYLAVIRAAYRRHRFDLASLRTAAGIK